MRNLKRDVAALAFGLALASGAALPAAAQGAGPGMAPGMGQGSGESLDELFEELARPGADHDRVADRIGDLWSRSGSASADLLLRRGRDALEAGDVEAAIDHLSALVDHAPDFAEAYSARATAFYAQGRAGEALADLVRALELEPRHFGALAGLGFVLEDLGHEQDALKAYKAAAALHPGIDMVNEAVERLEFTLGGRTL